MTDIDLPNSIANFRKSAKAFRDNHGSVEALVGADNEFAIHGITSIDGVPIEVDSTVTFIDTSGQDKPDIKLTGGMVYFHKDDHSMFGSKAEPEDDWFGDDWDDD